LRRPSQPLALPSSQGADPEEGDFLSGSTIGNFTPAEALTFLKQARKAAGRAASC